MISVAVLAGGAAASYYTRKQGCDRELLDDIRPVLGAPERDGLLDARSDTVGYYVNGRDLPGRWIGGGAEALGLTGAFDADATAVLRGLLDGCFAGEALVPPVWRRDDTGARVDVRRAGFDVTFSAPKSVSTLLALAPPEVVREVLAAHLLAAAEGLQLLESLAARAARGHQGEGRRAPRIGTDGFIGAAFTHTTSRALDPQLHTHVVIANLARGQDGRWSALDSRTLHREAITASALYHHRLRAELTERLGVGWTDIEHGVAELRGIPLEVRREFSTRRRQIEAALAGAVSPEGRGRTPQEAAQAACLTTRPAKTHAPIGELRKQWAARATAAGLSPEQLAELLRQRATPPEPVDMVTVVERVLSPDGVTRREPTFTQGALLREVMAALPPGAPVPTAELLRVTAATLCTDEVVPVITPDGRAFTTRDLLQTEAETLALATRSDTQLAQLDGRLVSPQLVRTRGLRAEQQRMAYALLTRGSPVDVVTGPAGCGKTAGLAVARRLWKEAGIEVRGAAVAALTAQGLTDASGAPSVSLSRALHRPEEHVPAGGVLLVDEAGMIGTRQLHQLLTLAQSRACKVVLVGDPQQLPELEAGGMFARLATEPSALTLDGHHRQQLPWERDALLALRLGDIGPSLESYRQHERLHVRHHIDELHLAAVTRYLDSRAEQSDPWQAVLLATSRDEVQHLNALVRAQLLAGGQLGSEAFEVETPDGPVSYREGEQVLVTRNDQPRRLLNGTTARVFALHPDGLTLQTGRGQHVRVGRQWLAEGRLDHGYAMTLHKAQGRTVHTALLVGSETLSAQAGYVGLSRGTHANHLFLTTSDLQDMTTDCGHAVQHRPALRRERPGPLTRDVRQRLALELPRPEPRTRDLA